MPTAFTIIFGLMLVIVLVSWILSGTHITADHKRIHALGVVDLFYAPFAGMAREFGVFVFVLAIGIFIYAVVKTNCFAAGTYWLVSVLKNKRIILIPIVIFFLAFLGSVEGFWEETLIIYAIVIPLAFSMGYDKMTGYLMVLIGAGTGCLATTVNPFVVNIAFNASGLPNASVHVSNGLLWRLLGFIVMTMVGCGFVVWYAVRVVKHQHYSVTFATYEQDKAFFLKNVDQKNFIFTRRQQITMVVFFLILLIMVVYLTAWDSIFKTSFFSHAGHWVNHNLPWITSQFPGLGNAGSNGLLYVTAFFLIGTFIVGAINWESESVFVKNIVTGAKKILGVALIIALATGISYLLDVSNMSTLIIKNLGAFLHQISYQSQLVICFFLFFLISFLISSTSAFANATFPLLGPTVGLKHLASFVFVFSYANGLANLICPFSGVLMASLAVTQISYAKFVRVVAPLIGLYLCLSLILIITGSFLVGHNSIIF